MGAAWLITEAWLLTMLTEKSHAIFLFQQNAIVFLYQKIESSFVLLQQ